MVAVNSWLKDRENGEVVRVVEIGALVKYRNASVDGEIRADLVNKEFEDISDPSTVEEIEAFLKAMIEAGEAETGLYNTGLAHVVVDRVDGEFTFEWFHDVRQLADLTES